MIDLQMLSLIKRFPIGGEIEDREDLFCKTSIICYLARNQEELIEIEEPEEREMLAKSYLSIVIDVGVNEKLPTLRYAEEKLNLSDELLHDYEKMSLIRENSTEFVETYETVAERLGLKVQPKQKLKIKRKCQLKK